MSSEPAKYWAFISYSSRDRRWGEWLRKRLENYRVPKDLQGRRFADGAILGKRLRPIFRDRDELAGSTDLGKDILDALRESRYLIILCSPNSAQSKWVNREIIDFRNMGKGDNILGLILDGSPNSGDPETECFPAALRDPVESLAADLRKEGDGKERGFLKILAGIAQLNFDRLYHRHERAARRARVAWGVVAMSLIAVFAILATLAILKREEAFEAAEQLRITSSQNDADLAVERIQNGNPVDALAHALRALDLNPENRLASVAAFSALIGGEILPPEWILTASSPVQCLEFSAGGDLLLAGYNDGKAQVVRVRDGTPAGPPIQLATAVNCGAISPDGRFAVLGTRREFGREGVVQIWDIEAGTIVENVVPETLFSVLELQWGESGHIVARCGWTSGSGYDHSYVIDAADPTQPTLTASFRERRLSLIDGTRLVMDRNFRSAKVNPPSRVPLSSSGFFFYDVQDASAGENWMPLFDVDREGVVLPGSGRLLTAADQGAVLINPLNQDPIHHFDFDFDQVAAISSDGDFLLFATDSKGTAVDAESGKSLYEFELLEGANPFFAVSAKGETVAGNEGRSSMGYHHIENGEVTRVPMKLASTVMKVAFDPDGENLIVATEDQIIRSWRLANLRDSIGLGVDEAAAWSRNGKRKISLNRGVAEVSDPSTPAASPIACFHGSDIVAAGISDNGLVGYTLGGGLLKFWQIQGEARETASVPMPTPQGEIDLRLSPTGKFLSAHHPVSAQYAGIKIFRSSDGLLLLDKQTQDRWEMLTFLTLSNSDEVILMGSPDIHEVHRFPPGATASELIWRRNQKAPGDSVTGWCLSPDKTRLAISYGNWSGRSDLSEPAVALLLDAATGDTTGSPMAHVDDVFHPGFSPDVRILITSSDDRTLRRWDGRTGEPIGRPVELPLRSRKAWYSRNAQNVLTETGQILTTGSWKIVLELRDSSQIEDAVFNEKNEWVVTSHVDYQHTGATTKKSRRVALWDLRSGRIIRQEMLDSKGGSMLALAPDCSFVILGGTTKIHLDLVAPSGGLLEFCRRSAPVLFDAEGFRNSNLNASLLVLRSQYPREGGNPSTADRRFIHSLLYPLPPPGP